MDQILPGLFVGGLRAANDSRLMAGNQIEAVVSVLTTEMSNARSINVSRKLQIPLDDLPNAPLDQYYGQAIPIHPRESNRETDPDLKLEKAHEFVRKRRFFANPNFGFRKQLEVFYASKTREEYRKALKNDFGDRHKELQKQDAQHIKSS
ncbi:hypothetical protein M3Y99_00500800 [Aphelenchoides fujianensis]|nr:hypothetical protein M3Y99_00500800 [Aphelenchoides fujianensis]